MHSETVKFSTTIMTRMGKFYIRQSADHAHYVSTASLNEFH